MMNGRPASGRGGDGTLDLVLGGGVDGAGGIIQDQDARVGQEGACDGQALALSAGEGDAALADDGLIAFFEFVDEIIRLGGFCGGFDLVRCGVRACRRRYSRRSSGKTGRHPVR